MYGVASNAVGIDLPVCGRDLVNFSAWQHGNSRSYFFYPMLGYERSAVKITPQKFCHPPKNPEQEFKEIHFQALEHHCELELFQLRDSI